MPPRNFANFDYYHRSRQPPAIAYTISPRYYALFRCDADFWPHERLSASLIFLIFRASAASLMSHCFRRASLRYRCARVTSLPPVLHAYHLHARRRHADNSHIGHPHTIDDQLRSSVIRVTCSRHGRKFYRLLLITHICITRTICYHALVFSTASAAAFHSPI